MSNGTTPPTDAGSTSRAGNVVPNSTWFVRIITAVTEPIGLFTLLVLVSLLMMIGIVGKAPESVQAQVLPLVIALLAVILITFVAILMFDPDRLYRKRPPPTATSTEPTVTFKPAPAPPVVKSNEWDQVFGADKPPPDIDGWYRRLRPTLHQASYYTVPTYYLDPDLYILDYNVAFELIFQNLAGRLRGRHVNWFINRLQNIDAVFEHARQFTDRVIKENRFPFIDLEPIVFDSPGFGRVTFTKVASQLHDGDGRLQGWAVALMIRHLDDWDRFERQLQQRLFLDKLWSIYAGPYDRILRPFPAYVELIQDVTAVLPGKGLCVADLGAGTGNVTEALLKQGQRVYAVESNVGMLDRLAVKTRGSPDVRLVKSSVEYLDCFKDQIFDGVVMVNVLYALDDPLRCLQEAYRILKPGGVLGFSTTHKETSLDALLDAIDQHVKTRPDPEGQLRADYEIVKRVNRDIEVTIARRHSREEYWDYVKTAGFEVTRRTDSTYHDAVMLVHARKKA